MRVGIGQIDSLVGAFEQNAARILERIDEARGRGCELVLFPEFAVPGAFPLDLVLRPGFVEGCEDAIDEIRRGAEGIAVVVGSIAPEKRRGVRPQLRNCSYVIENASIVTRIDKTHVPTDEARYFAPGPGAQTVDVASRRLGVSLGDPLEAGEGPIDLLASLGAEWIVQLAASPFRVGKLRALRRQAAESAIENGVGIVYVNCVGGADGTVFDGGSFAADQGGNLVFQAPCFEEGLYVFEIDSAEPIEEPNEDALDLTRSAIVLGTRDYVTKNGFSSVIVGLSGGIDSALVAALAVEALGPSAVTGVYLPCAHSSCDSLADAREVSKRLGIELIEIPAAGVHAALREALPFDPVGFVDENLQARARAVLWMALSNARNALVLATGNKSEIAIGYCTLYGDTTGALAPIADLYKTDVYRLAKSFGDRIPNSVLQKAPSAELRPDQKDEDDLPPYDTLDALLLGLIDENASRAQLIERGFDEGLVDDVLRRFYAAEYKRRQLPPGIAVTDHPFGAARRAPLTHTYRD
ncbi:MAG: NAD+ synthase [Candidatus Bipolaricaulia bacterium]